MAWNISPPSYSRLCERALVLARRSAAFRRRRDGILIARCCDCVTDRVRSVGLDSSGISLSEEFLWREEAWGRDDEPRKWLKFHVLSDTDTGEILAYALTESKIGDTTLLPMLVDMAVSGGHKFDVLYADGAYSSVTNWKHITEMGVKFVTSFKSNTVPRNKGCLARGEAARLWCSLQYDDWVIESGYGTRWKCECVFSSFKRLFRETVSARTPESIALQIDARVHLFNGYKGARAEIMKITGNGVIVA